MADCLCVSGERGVVRLTLNRPDRRNALSLELLSALECEIRSVANDPTARVLVLAANGTVFSSGHDLGEIARSSESDQRKIFELCTRVMLGLRSLTVPVVARVQGLAAAAGCQLVAACDLAVAADSAAFSTPGVKIGLFCTTPMVPLVRVIPPRIALEMLMTATPITALRALEVGLVNRVVPATELDAAVETLTASLIAQSPRVLEIGKKAFYELQPLDEVEAYALATELMVKTVASRDAREGISAFLEKRPPDWGRSRS